MSLANWANFLTVFQVCLVLYKQWITADGKYRLMYWLMVAAGLLGLVSHSMMAWVATDIAIGLLSTLTLMFWSVVMGIKGLVRLNHEARRRDPTLSSLASKGTR